MRGRGRWIGLALLAMWAASCGRDGDDDDDTADGDADADSDADADADADGDGDADPIEVACEESPVYEGCTCMGGQGKVPPIPCTRDTVENALCCADPDYPSFLAQCNCFRWSCLDGFGCNCSFHGRGVADRPSSCSQGTYCCGESNYSSSCDCNDFDECEPDQYVANDCGADEVLCPEGQIRVDGCYEG